jgi:cysteinyl-tRNA synthetase
LRELNVHTSGTIFPRATAHIPEQIKIIEELERKGYTYKTSDGIYFDTARFPDYGKLGNINIGGLREGERIGVNDEKRNLTDFALWKFSPTNEKREQEWPSPWGVGFPGWHIECSAMAMKYLGETFDIHTGGIDHIPVHHNNEIAQSECATNHQFVHIWMHNEFMSVDGKKMSKSLGNFYTMADFHAKHVNPLAYRYFLLNARYSTPMNFTWESLGAATNAYEKLVAHAQKLDEVEPEGHSGVESEVISAMADDLDTPGVIATLWNALKSDDVTDAQKKSILLLADRLLGLKLFAQKKIIIPEAVLILVEKRKLARAEKNYTESDRLRKEIETHGFTVKDNKEGQDIIQL